MSLPSAPRRAGRLLGTLLGLLVCACVSRADIEDLKKSQGDILAKLEKLEKTQPQRPPSPAAPMPGPDPSKVYAVSVSGSVTDGPDDAWVTVVAFSDFQCPFCERASKTLAELRAQYGADLRLVFKHNPLPFHSRGEPAALAAECAREQGKFWPMHDRLFANTQALADADLEGDAKAVGLDLKKFKACYTAKKPKGRIAEDQAQARAFNSRGTPNFFINGHFLSGAQRIDVFKQIVDAELQKAKQSGVARAAYYSRVVEEQGEKSI